MDMSKFDPKLIKKYGKKNSNQNLQKYKNLYKQY